jgi:hypothetical protein
MQFDNRDDQGHAEFQAALDARDKERERQAVDAYYRQRAEATLRDLCRQDFPLY